MDEKRAQEISFSPTLVNVSCNGKSIYIEHVDQQNGMATVHPLDEPLNKQSVSVESLIEQ
jgi:small acid-soluble spore protein H (minor)